MRLGSGDWGMKRGVDALVDWVVRAGTDLRDGNYAIGVAAWHWIAMAGKGYSAMGGVVGCGAYTALLSDFWGLAWSTRSVARSDPPTMIKV